MRNIVTFDSLDDVVEFLRVCSNVARHIELDYAQDFVSEYPTPLGLMYGESGLCYPVRFKRIGAYSAKFVTLGYKLEGDVVVTVRNGSWHKVLETEVNMDAVSNPTNMRLNLVGLTRVIAYWSAKRKAFAYDDYRCLFRNV